MELFLCREPSILKDTVRLENTTEQTTKTGYKIRAETAVGFWSNIQSFLS